MGKREREGCVFASRCGEAAAGEEVLCAAAAVALLLLAADMLD